MPQKPRQRLSLQTRRFQTHRRRRGAYLERAAHDRRDAFLELQYAIALKRREPSPEMLARMGQEPIELEQFKRNYDEAVAHQLKAKKSFRHV